jgi:hypothetical protein
MLDLPLQNPSALERQSIPSVCLAEDFLFAKIYRLQSDDDYIFKRLRALREAQLYLSDADGESRRGHGAMAYFAIAIRSTNGTKPLALRRANHLHGNREDHLFCQNVI